MMLWLSVRTVLCKRYVSLSHLLVLFCLFLTTLIVSTLTAQYLLMLLQAVFQCLAASCTSETYGPAVISFLSGCLNLGATFPTLYPVDLQRRHNLLPRQFVPMALGPVLDAVSTEQTFTFTVECNAGPDGVLTLSLPDSTSPATDSSCRLDNDGIHPYPGDGINPGATGDIVQDPTPVTTLIPTGAFTSLIASGSILPCGLDPNDPADSRQNPVTGSGDDQLSSTFITGSEFPTPHPPSDTAPSPTMASGTATDYPQCSPTSGTTEDSAVDGSNPGCNGPVPPGLPEGADEGESLDTSSSGDFENGNTSTTGADISEPSTSPESDDTQDAESEPDRTESLPPPPPEQLPDDDQVHSAGQEAEASTSVPTSTSGEPRVSSEPTSTFFDSSPPESYAVSSAASSDVSPVVGDTAQPESTFFESSPSDSAEGEESAPASQQAPPPETSADIPSEITLWPNPSSDSALTSEATSTLETSHTVTADQTTMRETTITFIKAEPPSG